MSESHQEMVGRVEAMARDKGETWDLSENDQAAIGYVLGLLAEGCDVRCLKCMAPNAGVRSVCGSCGAVLPHADAADARVELTTLRTRTEKMEQALREIAGRIDAGGHFCDCVYDEIPEHNGDCLLALLTIAREALEKGE